MERFSIASRNDCDRSAIASKNNSKKPHANGVNSKKTGLSKSRLVNNLRTKKEN